MMFDANCTTKNRIVVIPTPRHVSDMSSIPEREFRPFMLSLCLGL